MEIFCDKQHDKKEIAIGEPILEKPEKRQQSKTTDHFVNIQSHIYSYSHEYEEYNIENDPEFFHEWSSDIFGVLSQDMKIICINAKIILQPLHCRELLVYTVLTYQFGVGTSFGYLAFMDHDDFVRILNGAEPVGYHH